MKTKLSSFLILGFVLSASLHATLAISSQLVLDTANKVAQVNTNDEYAKYDDIKLLTYNVYLLPRGISDWLQDVRAKYLTYSNIFDGHDAVILNELFDTVSSKTLLDGLKSKYPHHTPVVGSSKEGWNTTLGNYSNTASANGGVAIISRWPIVEKVQYIYASGCGWDNISNKGFAYIKINKNGNFIHIIGTHTQAEDSLCQNAAAIRTRQFQNIQNFIETKSINPEEVVFIGGDLNVNKETPEYYRMIETLQVNPLNYAGYHATWDPKSNAIANYNHPKLKGEYLDYIFLSRHHAQPGAWQNQSIDLIGPRWTSHNAQFRELSDHYPVTAFVYANSQTTPTQSLRAINAPYSAMKIYNKGNLGLLQSDPLNESGWLFANGRENDNTTIFSIDNGYPKNAFCIKNGDFINIKSVAEPKYYWNWLLNGSAGDFSYYLKANDGSNQLRIKILDDEGQCLKPDDRVAFLDRDTRSGKDYYITRWPTDSWKNYLFLWGRSVGKNETFIFQGMAQPEYEQWRDKLIY